MASLEHPQRGVVAVIPRANRLLVIRRSKHVVAPRAFCFPGGGIKPRETESSAIERECHEELGVACLARERIWQSITPWNVELSWWLTDIAEDALIQPNAQEVESAHWLTPLEIRELDELLESNIHFLDAWDRAEFELPKRSPPVSD